MPEPHLKHFSNEIDTRDVLKYMVILYEISLNRDHEELKRFVKLISLVIDPEDFNKLLRRTIRMMGNSKCGRDLCSDWIMTKLYDQYTSAGAL